MLMDIMSKHLLKTARSIMHHPVRCVEADETVVKAARRLAKKGWSGAPVVNSTGEIVGMLSEVDVVHALSSAAFFETPPPTLVRDVMNSPVKSVGPNTDLFQLVTLIGTGPHKRVPVVEDGKPIGIVTRKDVMKVLIEVVEERWGDRSLPTYDAIAAIEGTHNPFSKR